MAWKYLQVFINSVKLNLNELNATQNWKLLSTHVNAQSAVDSEWYDEIESQTKNLISLLDLVRSFIHISLYKKSSPKWPYFSYHGMIVRTQLAVLDLNSGVDLEQSKEI